MKPIDIAITQIGMKEDPIGSNWGNPVQDYLLSVGITFPASWCMAFVYWCVKQVDVINALKRTGGVLDQWNSVDASHKFQRPAPGDIFIMDHGGGLGHTGFVESVDGDLIHTVEGNTNDSVSREGYEVCRRIRHASKCIGFIRL